MEDELVKCINSILEGLRKSEANEKGFCRGNRNEKKKKTERETLELKKYGKKKYVLKRRA